MNTGELTIVAAIGTLTVLIVLYQAGWLRPILCWLLVIIFGLSGLAAFFSMIASVIHFQIIWAVGYFLLAALLWFLGAIFTGLAQQ